MILENLWGLLLLLSIPLLIVIYIIKQDHKERTVSSTYLWHLSEKFLKKRLPIKRITSLTAFLLQLAILTLLALSATQPAVSLGQISGQIVIIDASASMQTELDGVTRFDAAVAKVKALAQSGVCSSMTVIIASDTPACIVTGGSTSQALSALERASCGYGGCDIYESMRLAREAYAHMGTAKVTLYTDTQYAEVENVSVVDMNRGEVNVAITALTHMGGTFEGTLTSYGEDRDVTVGLSVDGVVVDTALVSLVDGQPTQVKFTNQPSRFGLATLFFDIEDGLAQDNAYSVVGKSTEKASVLVVGTDTLFFEEGFSALGNCDVTLEEQYDTAYEGNYDLYLFNGCVPEKDIFPKNGITLGFTQLGVQYRLLDDIQTPGGARGHGNAIVHSFLRDDLTVDPLMEGVDNALMDVYIRKYVDTYIAPTVTPAWTPLLGVSSRYPMGLVRELRSGARHYLFLFPISETNLAMTPAFLMILNNAVTLALPPSLPQKAYAVGETVEMTLKKKAENPAIKQPDGTLTTLHGESPTFVATKPGLYALTYDLNNQSREAAFFVHIPILEYETYSTDTVYFSKPLETSAKDKLLSSSMLPWIAVILSALLVFEWGYHYRGKR